MLGEARDPSYIYVVRLPKRQEFKQKIKVMKNTWTIINSDLTREEKHLADMLNEEWMICKHKEVKAIKSIRKELNYFNYTEKQLENVCAFHNILDEYCKTL